MNRFAKIILSVVVFVLVLGLLIVGYIAFFAPTGENGDSGPVGRIIQLFPFGDGVTTDPAGRADPPTDISTTTPVATGELPRLRQLWQKPVSGARFVQNSNGDSNFVRFVDQESGNVFDADTRSFSQTRITNTTIPGVREAIFAGDGGENLILRYLNDGEIETFLASIAPSDETSSSTISSQLSGSFLERGINVIETLKSVSIFYITGSADSARFIISSIDGKNKAEIARSAIEEWVPDWPSEQTLFLTTKASSETLGYAYKLNQATGALEKVIGDALALTTKASPNGSYLLTSLNESGRPVLGLYNIDTSEYSSLTFSTLSEKCAWSQIEEMTVYCAVPNTPIVAGYPDLWYQGLTSSSDSLWRINIEDGTGNLLVNPAAEIGTEIDIWNPTLAPDSDYIVFQNKRDKSLYSYRLIEDN